MLAVGFAAFAQAVVTDSLEFGKGVYNTPEYLIQGQVAGVRVTTTDGSPTSAVNTNIRGLNAVRGTSEPLWIVDGVMLSSSSGQVLNAFWNDEYAQYNYMAPLSQLDNLNLYDIQSIQVLKNTSATAIYGAKGANGVIIVNTKNPVSEKNELTWNSNVSLTAPAEKNPHLSTPAFSHNHNIAFGSKVGRAQYRLSAFFRDVKSPVPGVDDKQGGLRAKFETKANPYIWFGMNANLSVGKQMSTTTTAWYGTPSMGIALRDLVIPGVINTVQGWAKDYDDYAIVFRTSDAAYLQVNFLPWLRWRTDFGLDYQTNTRYFWFGDQTQFGASFNRAAASSLISLMKYFGKSTIDIDTYIAKKHHLKVSLGAAADGDVNRFNTMNGCNYATDLLRAKGYSFKESATMPRWTYQQLFNLSFLGTLSYDFNGIVGLNAALRAERAVRYDENFTLFPGGDIYFDIHNAFFRDAKAVSTLRIEGGYGKAGARKTIPYPLMPKYVESAYMNAALASHNIVIDENEPTKTQSISSFFDGYNRVLSTEYNASIKAGFLDDRILLNVGVYNKNTSDRFSFYSFGEEKTYYGRKVYRVSERKAIFDEATDILNNGIEAEIKVNPVRTSLVNWTVFANAAYNYNKITALGEGDSNLSVISATGVSANRNIVGQPVGSIYGVTTYNPDGTGNFGIIGNPCPKITGSVGTTLKVQRFTLDAIANGAWDFYVVDLNRFWLKKQTDVSAQYLHKGDYFRLARLSLKYDIPVQNVKWIKNLAVSATATNLFTFTTYTGYNPEVNSFGSISNSGVGMDYGSLPLMRTFMIGVCANF